jgi:hypothetical protein
MREAVAVDGYATRGDVPWPGTIIQVGYHESGNERLVAVSTPSGVRWFDRSLVKMHD